MFEAISQINRLLFRSIVLDYFIEMMDKNVNEMNNKSSENDC
jgi:hypothetical protein